MNSLRITTWNINGISNKTLGYNKLQDREFIQSILKYDVIGLLETHSDETTVFNVEGYYSFSVNRQMNQKAKRASGGIAVLIRNNLKTGIRIVKTDDMSICLCLDKSFFQCDKDIYLIIAYLPPENSTYLKSLKSDPMSYLENSIEQYQKCGEVIIMGDLNGRTAENLDYIINDDCSFNSCINYNVDLDQTCRNNQDRIINKRGKELLDLCIAAQLRILNGRTMGDTIGLFTCHKYNGSSTVDYGITSESISKDIVYFHVHDLNSDLSDHCQISLRLHGLHYSTIKQNTVNFTQTLPSFIWNEDSEIKFTNALKEQKHILQDLEKRLDMNTIDTTNAVDAISDIFISCATKSLKKKVGMNNRSASSYSKQKRWFKTSLTLMRHELKKSAQILCRNPLNPISRRNYYYQLRLYRKRCKHEKRKFQQDILNKLDNLYESNPSEYWKLFKTLTEKSSKPTLEVPKDDLYEHYLKLNKDDEVHQKHEYNKLIEDLEKQPTFTELDYKFTGQEIINAIRQLKKRKSSGPDMILNEMIKSAQPVVINIFKKLFNLILLNGNYPSKWAEGRITSIHKSGVKTDPSNYRGITVSSSLGKLFNSILNNRLTKYFENNKTLSKYQTGFRAKHRTSDNLFILKSLIENFVKKKKELYIAFIDLRKAFDSIWHEGLFLKLLKNGVSTNFYNVLKSMYSKTRLKVVHGQEESPEFKSEKGVRQGDNLSPLLFNLFINDLPDIFDKTCSPVKWGEMEISSLLYADDLVLFSQSKEGLQNGLGKIEAYCKTWRLSINKSKTKVMCVSDQTNPYFHIDNCQLEIVTEFKYLGILMDNKGTNLTTQSDLYKRALKVYFKILNCLNPLPSVKTLLHLFDHMIKPILLYNCEIWSNINLEYKQSKISTVLNESPSFIASLRQQLTTTTKFMELNNPIEKLHMKFCKRILGVRKHTSNMGVYSELGQYPMYISQIVQSLRFYKHIQHADNTLLSEFWHHYDIKTMPKSNYKTFINQISTQLDINIESQPKNCIKVKHKLRANFENFWRQKINFNCKKCPNKLRTYARVKSHFKMEQYLNLKQFHLRKSLSKFRLSDHNLKIETDRYSKTYISPEQRLCNQCDAKICEDELHFLVNCKHYEMLRTKLYDVLHVTNKYFTTYDTDNKFLWMITSENQCILKEVSHFIHEAMNIRNNQ